MSSIFNYFGLNNKGNEPEYQEDSFYGFERNNILFLMVADGMGSKEGFDPASIIAINQVVNYIERYFPQGSQININSLKTLIDGGLYSANNSLLAYKMANPKHYSKLATSFTLCAITPNKQIVISHLGNCRIYILRKGNIHQITKDNTEAQELYDNHKITKEDLRIHPQRHILTNCLGIVHNFKYNSIISQLNKEDIVLLCTDGLYDLLFDEEIKNIILETQDTKTACEWLIAGANKRGGYDNITTLISFINF